MDISFDEQSQVLENLDKARKILRASKHDILSGDFKKAEIIDHINTIFHDVQVLDTRPY